MAARRGVDPSRWLSTKEGDWILPPLVPGAWVTLDQDEEAAIVPRILTFSKVKGLSAKDILRVRALPLAIYKNAMLFEAEVTRGPGKSRGTISFVRRGNEFTHLTGQSDVIHSMNQKSPPILDTVHQASQYLRFFTAGIQGEEGNFRLYRRI